MGRKLLQAFTTWVAVYPIITCLILVLDPLVRDWPTPARTLLLSSIMVPVMVIWAVPMMNRLVAAATSAGPALERKRKR